MKTKVVET